MSEDFRYKTRILKRTVTDEAGNSRTLEEKIVVYWSRKFQQRSEREQRTFLEFLRRLEELPESFRITALQSRGLRKFFKKECVNRKTGETVNTDDIRTYVDFNKVKECRESMGYYQIVTSELTLDPRQMIDKYHGLTQIEDQFREMKGSLATRPIYVRTPEHVEAHLLVCTISLILLRVIQKKDPRHARRFAKSGTNLEFLPQLPQNSSGPEPLESGPHAERFLPIHGPRRPRPRPDSELLRPIPSRETLPPRGAERTQKEARNFHIGQSCRSILSKKFPQQKSASPANLRHQTRLPPRCCRLISGKVGF